MSWKPKLSGSGPLHDRIVAALERDVRSGNLKNGIRLPAQRLLADHLGLSVGTVTKAYLEAERRGLARGQVGRGTYVTSPFGEDLSPGSFEDQIIDLSVNVVPHHAAVPYFVDYKSYALRQWEAFGALAYAPSAGPENQRRAAAVWLKRIANFDADWKRLIQTTGAQHAISLTFELLSKPGDMILCEEATFYGMKTLAQYRGYKLHGLKLDDEGIIPAGLETACRETKAKVLYLMPTAQNPTGRTMSKARRQAIAKIAQRNKLWLVEDDNYALFGNHSDNKTIPIATLLPERTFYIGGISKSLAPGLRLGFLVCPSGAAFDSIVQAIRATVYSPSALGGLLFAQWIEDGSAFKIVETVKDEIGRRLVLARSMLELDSKTPTSAPHLWLSLPAREAEMVVSRALRAGLVITPPESPILPGADISGIRLCLGTASSMEQLKVGLERLKGALSSKPSGWDSLV
ncbi:MAG: PLP-dependent aminotransferase family protein [Pseudomonadota bacterium]